MSDVEKLLPDLADWNNGRGISVHTWLQTFTRTDHALAYCDLVWPSFVEVGSYILRTGFCPKTLKGWEASSPALTPAQIEAVTNTLFLDDLLFGNEEWSALAEQRSVLLGRILSETHRIKLAHDYPDREFEVSFWDGTQSGHEISLSFWQKH